MSRPACESLERRRLLNAGDFDTTFGSSGTTALSFSGRPFSIVDTALQSDGKIVVAGQIGSQAAVARLNADGSIDTSFGLGGLTTYSSSDFESVQAVAVGSGGAIAITGRRPGDPFHQPDIAVGRLTPIGDRDSSFGSSGVVHTEIELEAFGEDVQVQTDGKIVVAGAKRSDNFVGHEDYDLVVLRYNTNGSLDSTFDGDGLVTADLGDDEIAHALAIDYTGNPDTNPLYGTIVVAGQKANENKLNPPYAFVLMRLNPDGSKDSSFDGDGKLTSPSLSIHGIENATGVVVQPGGKIVACGISANLSDPSQSEFLVARYNVDGSLDPTFGTAGTGAVELNIGTSDLAQEITSGYLGDLIVSGSSDGAVAIVALKPDGRLDTRFDGDGIRVTPVTGAGAGVAATGSSITPARRLVIIGSTTVGRLIDVGPVITVNPLDPNGAEAGSNIATFIVVRDEPRNVADRVFLTVSGTATPPNTFPHVPADYSGTNITFGNAIMGATFVDIPAGALFTTVTITPVDDTTAEGDETAIFTVAPGTLYDVGPTPSTTLVIRDNDVTGGPSITDSGFQFQTLPQAAHFTFSQDVSASIGASDFTVTGPSGSVPFNFSYDSITDTATLGFNGILPDGNYTAKAIAAGITNSGGTPMTADVSFNFFFLEGDANHDRAVDVTDLGILATNWQTAVGTFGQADFNYDGFVDVTDLGILATNWQKSLPAAAAPVLGELGLSPNRALARHPRRHDLLTDDLLG